MPEMSVQKKGQLIVQKDGNGIAVNGSSYSGVNLGSAGMSCC